MKIMSDHLAKQYGINDWESVVGLSTSSSNNVEDNLMPDSPNPNHSLKDSEISKVLGYSSSDQRDNSTSNMPPPNIIPNRSLSPLKKALINSTSMNDVSSPSKDSASTSPKKSILNQSFAGDSSVYGDAGDSSFMSAYEAPNNGNSSSLFNQNSTSIPNPNESEILSNFSSSNNLSSLLSPNLNQGRAVSLTPQKSNNNTIHTDASFSNDKENHTVSLDPKSILSSVQAVRLLISAFERQHALRSMELETLVNKAVEAGSIAEKRAREGLKEDLKEREVEVSATR